MFLGNVPGKGGWAGLCVVQPGRACHSAGFRAEVILLGVCAPGNVMGSEDFRLCKLAWVMKIASYRR